MVDTSSKKDNLSKRISKIRLDLCRDDNVNFAKMVEIHPSFASAICTGLKNAGAPTLNKILAAFPEVSRSWLYFGEGEMLTSAEPSSYLRRTSVVAPSAVAEPLPTINATQSGVMNSQVVNPAPQNSDPVVSVLLDRLKDKDETILTLRDTIRTLQGEVEQLRSYVPITSSKYINIVERMLNTTTETNELIKAGYDKIGFRMKEEGEK